MSSVVATHLDLTRQRMLTILAASKSVHAGARPHGKSSVRPLEWAHPAREGRNDT